MIETLPSVRAEATTRRTYNRPLDEDGKTLETWEATANRATRIHHRRLWDEAGGRPDDAELDELFDLVHSRRALVSGRTLWLGGTDYSSSRACSQFNCAYTRGQTVFEFVDIFWLLLNGCGVGGRPIAGTLHGFLKPIPKLNIIESTQPADHKGHPHNVCVVPTAENGYHWTIKIGDSAEAWAKSLGKLLNPPTCAVNALTLDFSDVRGPGKRLKGYGWICNGSKPLQQAYIAIFEIMNSKAGDLLDEIDLLDVINWLGTVLSSRRSAQILVMDYNHPRWEQFARAKTGWWTCNTCGSQNTNSKYFCPDCGGRTNAHRQQSNNSLVFWHKPTKREIRDIMQMIWDCGGSEPGFINGVAARNRAPWFDGLNPCGEILLQSRGFCNLVTTAVSKFNTDFAKLQRALYIMGRANYRQTCVALNDGVLMPEWNQTNASLRLCGMSLTGIAQSPWLTDYQIKQMRNAAVAGCYSMADELGLPRPKLVTTIKPEGTGSKIMDVTEGIHKPLGQFIFNWIIFPANDPLVTIMAEAGYRVIDHPQDKLSKLVCFPVDYTGCRFDMHGQKQVNTDSAVMQLDVYRRWNTLWTDHNSSITVSWDIAELDDIVEWLYRYWNDFVAVAWLRRTDPTKTAKDLGYAYLPQEVVTHEDYRSYTATLQSVDWSRVHGIHDLVMSDCAGGVCPVK